MTYLFSLLLSSKSESLSETEILGRDLEAEAGFEPVGVDELAPVEAAAGVAFSKLLNTL